MMVAADRSNAYAYQEQKLENEGCEHERRQADRHDSKNQRFLGPTVQFCCNLGLDDIIQDTSTVPGTGWLWDARMNDYSF